MKKFPMITTVVFLMGMVCGYVAAKMLQESPRSISAQSPEKYREYVADQRPYDRELSLFNQLPESGRERVLAMLRRMAKG